VNRHAGEVMPASVHPEALDVGHMGKPGDWVPVGPAISIQPAESPRDAFPGQTRFHRRIVRYIDIVIIIDEIVVPDTREHGDGDHREEKINGEIAQQVFLAVHGTGKL
jgi:hypothetical protein